MDAMRPLCEENLLKTCFLRSLLKFKHTSVNFIVTEGIIKMNQDAQFQFAIHPGNLSPFVRDKIAR